MENELILLVGPSGSGKSTFASSIMNDSSVYVSQDSQGKRGHKERFVSALKDGVPRIIIDRCNFDREQRARFLLPAKEAGYVTTIIDLTKDPTTCFNRIINRENHPTLGQDKDVVLKALYCQFKDYEKPTLEEADNVNHSSDYDPYCLDLTDQLDGGQYWIVGDIHGCFDEFIDLEYEMNKENKKMKAMPCVSVGDLVDKGPEINLVLKHFMKMPNYYTVMGNHENKLLRYLVGNKVNTNSLKETIDQIKDMDKYKVATWLMGLPKLIKIGRNFIFHAGINPTKSIMKQNRATLLYARKFNPNDESFADLPGSKYWHEYIKDADVEHRYSRRFFGHHFHPEVSVAYNTYALDGHCVYGKKLRGMLMPNRTIKAVKAKKQYKDPINSKSYYDEVLEPFEEEVAKGNLRKVESGDLILYNYTDKCTYDKQWNDITKQARGLIFNKKTGECLARPFLKFWNVNEMPETRLENLPNEEYECFDKLDGSLGVVFHDGEKWRVATRGSFESDQAKRGQAMLEKYDMDKVPTYYTLLTEIIYPENRFSSGARLVTDYGNTEDLFLLAMIDRRNGKEKSHYQLEYVVKHTRMPLVKKYNHTIKEMIEMQKTLPAEREGFVVRFKSGLRVKIKGEEYMKIHRVLNSITPLFFWSNMVDGKVDVKLLEMVPEEYRDEAETLAAKLELKYKNMKDGLLKEMDVMHASGIWGDSKDPAFRKEVGLYIQRFQPDHGTAFFPHLYGKEKIVDKYIRGRIRPVGNVL